MRLYKVVLPKKTNIKQNPSLSKLNLERETLPSLQEQPPEKMKKGRRSSSGAVVVHAAAAPEVFFLLLFRKTNTPNCSSFSSLNESTLKILKTNHINTRSRKSFINKNFSQMFSNKHEPSRSEGDRGRRTYYLCYTTENFKSTST